MLRLQLERVTCNGHVGPDVHLLVNTTEETIQFPQGIKSTVHRAGKLRSQHDRRIGEPKSVDDRDHFTADEARLHHELDIFAVHAPVAILNRQVCPVKIRFIAFAWAQN